MTELNPHAILMGIVTFGFLATVFFAWRDFSWRERRRKQGIAVASIKVKPPLQAIREGREVDALIGVCKMCEHQGAQVARISFGPTVTPWMVCHDCIDTVERATGVQ